MLIAMPLFMLPSESKDIPASEILAKIQTGQPVIYDHVIIKGNLILDQSNLTVIKSPISVNNSIIYGKVNIKDALFDKCVEFVNTSFNEETAFTESRFNNTTDFRGSKFNDTTYFWNSTFNKTVNFGGSRFNETIFFKSYCNGPAYFNNSIFNGTAEFGYSYFNKIACLNNSKFNREANFNKITFFNDAKFSKSNFEGTVDFESSKFRGIINFNNSHFNGLFSFFSYSNFEGNPSFKDAIFNGTGQFLNSNFNGHTYFGGTKFNAITDFSNSNFDGISDFTASIFSGDAFFQYVNFNKYADFERSQFNKESNFEGSHFRGNLNLNKTKYDKFIIRWSSIDNLVYDVTSYQSLIENFRRLGLFDDADDCYYHFRSGQLEHRDPYADLSTYILDSAAKIFYGYGVFPLIPLEWSIIVIFVCGVFFFLSNSIQRSEEIPHVIRCNESMKENVKNFSIQRVSNYFSNVEYLIINVLEIKRTISLFEAILFSATYFTSGGSNLILSLPKEFSPTGMSRYVVILERVLGWVFFALFVTALLRTVMR